MQAKTKRTHNRSRTTIERVRELVAQSGIARTQDGVVEAAVERPYLEVRAREETELWSAARDDEAFQAEMEAMARHFRDAESWPR
ncbi:MAG TPA: hypothetical protein VNO86_09270 [Candidatus Binatia bacterium]|nr:hypothetical protein [Candidatus Binatia bacterium]